MLVEPHHHDRPTEFEFTCPACGIPIATDGAVGSFVSCPTCGSESKVPPAPPPQMVTPVEPTPATVPTDGRLDKPEPAELGSEEGREPVPSATPTRWLFTWLTWSACGTALLSLVLGWRAFLAFPVLASGVGIAILLISGVSCTRTRCPCGCRWVESSWEIDPRFLPLRHFTRTSFRCCRCGRNR